MAAAVADLGRAASVLAVSGAVYLHPWVVIRRLKELGLSIAGMDWQPVKKQLTEKQRAANNKMFNREATQEQEQ